MTDCDAPDIVRLEYAPYHVAMEWRGDDLVPTDHNELLDAPWIKTDSYWCRTCDTELTGEQAALIHANTGDRPVQIPEVAREAGVPQDTVAEVLRALVDEGHLDGKHVGIDVRSDDSLELPEDQVPEAIELVIDMTEDEGIEWFQRWGQYASDCKPVVVEKLEGVMQCEECREEKPCYMVANTAHGVPVCIGCLEGHPSVLKVRT